ncbi:hypothetical protein IFVP136_C210081 [Vibrio parahaemolyticus]
MLAQISKRNIERVLFLVRRIIEIKKGEVLSSEYGVDWDTEGHRAGKMLKISTI